jgi:hypothetical protein
MRVQCPNCGEMVEIDGLGRKPLDIPLTNILEALLEHGSVKDAAEELHCSEGYIFGALKANQLKLREIIERAGEIEENKGHSPDVRYLFGFWNNQKIVVHPELTGEICQAIEKKLQDFSVEQICKAISNYSEILKSPDYRFNHPWTLEDFLNKGINKFLNRATAGRLSGLLQCRINDRREMPATSFQLPPSELDSFEFKE